MMESTAGAEPLISGRQSPTLRSPRGLKGEDKMVQKIESTTRGAVKKLHNTLRVGWALCYTRAKG